MVDFKKHLKKKKTMVWIQGSMGSGKTTQVKMLIDALTEGDIEPKVITDTKVYYTVYDSGICALGKIGKNQCTGLDSVYSQLGADGVCNTLKHALDDDETEIILVDCAFATISWYNKWIAAGLRDKFKLLAIHLELDEWENYKRISQRKAKKAGIEEWWDIHLPDTVYKNVGSKNRETRNIYHKLEGSHPKKCDILADAPIQIRATMPPKVIHKKILNHIAKHL